MALNGLLCADMPLRNLTHSLTHSNSLTHPPLQARTTTTPSQQQSRDKSSNWKQPSGRPSCFLA